MRAITLFTTVVLFSAALINAYDPVKMLCLVNKERGRSGRAPLGMSKQLENSAQKHSDDQARMGSMTHDGSDGSSPGDRVERAGFNWRGVAENVAYGYGDEEECMQEWMNSPGHRENILGDYTHFGSAVGYAGSTPYYTQDFASDGQSHDFPECPSGDAYGDSDSSGGGYGNEGADDYSGGGGSSPSNDYSGGGSSPSNDYSGGGSSPSKNYSGGGSSPSKYGKSSPSKSYGGGSSPSKNYNGGSAPSSGRRHQHKSGRKPSSYGGDVSDNNNTRKKTYGSKKNSNYGDVSDDDDSRRKPYGGRKNSNHGRRHQGGRQPHRQGRRGSRHGGNRRSYGNKPAYGRKGGRQGSY